jgi:serine protease Do
LVAQLKDKGVVSRGWIGVQFQPFTAETAENLGMKGSEVCLGGGAAGRQPCRQSRH